MKKVILAGVVALGLSACCGGANAAILEIVDLTRLERPYLVDETPYNAVDVGISNRGNNEYEYINTMFGTSFTALNQLSLKISSGVNEGPFAHSYYREIRDNTFQIEFNSTPGDGLPTTPIDCDLGCFLAVKDGNNQERPYYFFDISDWDGDDKIFGFNFWDGTQGAISHVSIWQGSETKILDKPPENVPEPSILALIGLGLFGFSLRKSLTSKSRVVK